MLWSKIVWLKFGMMRIWRRRYLLSAPPQLPTDRSPRWVFPRGQIPQDLVDDEPDSTTWGNPWAFFPFGDSCPSTHFSTLGFQDHLLRTQNTHTKTLYANILSICFYWYLLICFDIVYNRPFVSKMFLANVMHPDVCVLSGTFSGCDKVACVIHS